MGKEDGVVADKLKGASPNVFAVSTPNVMD
jgi:hypothetical protein